MAVTLRTRSESRGDEASLSSGSVWNCTVPLSTTWTLLPSLSVTLSANLIVQLEPVGSTGGSSTSAGPTPSHTGSPVKASAGTCWLPDGFHQPSASAFVQVVAAEPQSTDAIPGCSAA